MAITPKLYDTSTLLGVMREQEAPSNYWLDLLFNNTVTFDDEFIDFEKLTPKGRRLAAFVAPLAQGKPLFREGSTVTRLKAAYVKAKDPVNPTRMLRRRPGELLAPVPASPEARRNAIIADILATHRDGIERRWEWLAARAAIDGKVTIEGENYPARLVDFQRDAGHTITLAADAEWGDAGVSIYDNLQTWITMMRNAKFGGAVNRITMGPDAWDIVRKDDEIKEQLDLNTRGTVANLNTVVRDGAQVDYVGNLGPNLPVYVYSDYYEDETGASVPILDSKSVVLTGPNVQGVRAYGAIQDAHANFQALPIFSRNWIGDDPAIEQVGSQSAPLMIPVNPNNTLVAKVKN